jgi:spermidine synthase
LVARQQCSDWVEIDAGVVDVARRYFSSVCRGSFDDPKVQLHITDGLRFVAQALANRQSYDLIVLDLTDPQGLAIDLYTPTFFAQCASILSRYGVLAMHLGAPFFHAERVTQLLNDLVASFRIVRPFGVNVPLYGAYWGFATASQFIDPRQLTQSQVEKRLEEREIRDLNCYSPEFHVGAMQLPKFFAKLKIR